MSGGIPIVGDYPTSSHEYYQSGHLWNDKMIKKQYQVCYNKLFYLTSKTFITTIINDIKKSKKNACSCCVNRLTIISINKAFKTVKKKILQNVYEHGIIGSINTTLLTIDLTVRQ